MPQSQKDYIIGWHRLMPDWEIIRWDESNFKVDFCEYTAKAYQCKKWAFVSDVARLYALDKFGGVYLDTDIKLFSSLESFHNNKAFTGFEWYIGDYEEKALPLLDNKGKPIHPGTIIPACGLVAGIIGAESNNPIIHECLDRYTSMKNINDTDFVIINNLIAGIAEKYGFCYQNRLQELGVITVYPSDIFASEPYHYRDYTVAIHRHSASWMTLTKRQRFERWLDCHNMLKGYKFLCKIFKKIMP